MINPRKEADKTRRHKFIYRDEWGMLTVKANISSCKYLGMPPEKLDNNQYLWGAVKLPKGKTWGKDTIIYEDKGYAFSKISLHDNHPDLYIKFIPRARKNFYYRYSTKHGRCVCAVFKQEALYLTIKNYETISAYEVIEAFSNPATGESCIGRHFENAILTFWKSKHLPFRKENNIWKSSC